MEWPQLLTKPLSQFLLCLVEHNFHRVNVLVHHRHIRNHDCPNVFRTLHLSCAAYFSINAFSFGDTRITMLTVNGSASDFIFAAPMLFLTLEDRGQCHSRVDADSTSGTVGDTKPLLALLCLSGWAPSSSRGCFVGTILIWESY